MSDTSWETSLTHTSADEIAIRGYDLTELIGRVGFSSALFLLYTGELPTEGEAAVIEALMVASIDHGPEAPSAQAARLAISGGATLQAAAAAGILAMGKYHGTAVEGCMVVLAEVAADSSRVNDAAEEVVSSMIGAGERVPGFGHRQHKDRDPRIDRLLAVASKEGVGDTHARAAKEIEGALERVVGKPIPMNIDGAMAAILCDLGFPIEMANALFIASRLVGVLGHAVEEQGMTPMRRIDPASHVYAGPSARSISEEE